MSICRRLGLRNFSLFSVISEMSADIIAVHRGEWEVSANLVGKEIMIVVLDLDLDIGRLALTNDPNPMRWRTRSITVCPGDILERPYS